MGICTIKWHWSLNISRPSEMMWKQASAIQPCRGQDHSAHWSVVGVLAFLLCGVLVLFQLLLELYLACFSLLWCVVPESVYSEFLSSTIFPFVLIAGEPLSWCLGTKIKAPQLSRQKERLLKTRIQNIHSQAPHITAEKNKQGKALTTIGTEPRPHRAKRQEHRRLINELNGPGLGKAEWLMPASTSFLTALKCWVISVT